MNEGRLLKFMYSPDPDVSAILQEALDGWVFGYSEQVRSLDGLSEEGVVFTMGRQADIESTKAFIDFHLHLFCGFSLFPIDSSDIKAFFGSGSLYRTLSVTGPEKELGYRLWHALKKSERDFSASNLEIKSVGLTIVGKDMGFDDVEFYGTIAKNFASNIFLPNTCLFDDGCLGTSLQLHFVLDERAKPDMLDDLDCPAFMRNR